MVSDKFTLWDCCISSPARRIHIRYRNVGRKFYRTTATPCNESMYLRDESHKDFSNASSSSFDIG